jgi:lipopolysaccharide export system protein LptC
MNRVITARTDPQTARAYWTMSGADTERVFRAARRHSRLVRALRLAISVLVIGGLGFEVLVTYINPLGMFGKLPIDVGNLVVSGSKITMEHPRLSGFTRDGRAYEMTALAAKQDLTKPDFVELQRIHATVQMQDGNSMQLEAANGLYNVKTEKLELENDIVLTGKDFEGRLSQASVDAHTGHIESDKPVNLKMLQGTLDANHLEIVDSGDLVRFTKGVSMDLHLDRPATEQPADGGAKP